MSNFEELTLISKERYLLEVENPLAQKIEQFDSISVQEQKHNKHMKVELEKLFNNIQHDIKVEFDQIKRMLEMTNLDLRAMQSNIAIQHSYSKIVEN